MNHMTYSPGVVAAEPAEDRSVDVDVEYFWDPMCPWAWVGSRWVTEVAAQRGLEVDWRFIALRLVNEGRDYATEFPEGYLEHHTRSLRLLRVAACIRDGLGRRAVGDYYTALGTLIHEQHRHEELDPEGSPTLRDVIAGAGGDPAWVARAEDEDLDVILKDDLTVALDRVGIDAGTPIITFGPPDGPSIFGPVLSRRVTGAEALELWDATAVVAHEEGLSEIKRRRPRFSTFDTFPIRNAAAVAAEAGADVAAQPADDACMLPSAQPARTAG